MKKEIPYLRVGTNYFKKVQQPLASGIDSVERLIDWNKDTIKEDHNSSIFSKIPKYDGFCLIPSHTDYKREYGTFYNKYEPLAYKPIQGNIDYTMKFLQHIFAGYEENQLEIGLDYLQLIFLKPTEILPILCLVSLERNTGKTTFLKWLKAIYGRNMTLNTNEDFKSNFNSDWVNKLIVAVDETLFEKKEDTERLKNLNTAGDVKLEAKTKDKVEIENFMKFILTSNNEDSFVKIDTVETRFWVRKIPILKDDDPFLLEKLKNEIPAFLYFLKNRELFVKIKYSRAWFKTEHINTLALQRLKKRNRPFIEAELIDYLKEHMADTGKNVVCLTKKEIKEALLPTRTNNNSFVFLEKDWGLVTENSSYAKYTVDADGLVDTWSKKGRFYTFTKELVEKIENNFWADKTQNQSITSCEAILQSASNLIETDNYIISTEALPF